jgi:hypothetical protein
MPVRVLMSLFLEFVVQSQRLNQDYSMMKTKPAAACCCTTVRDCFCVVWDQGAPARRATRTEFDEKSVIRLRIRDWCTDDICFR